MARRTISVAERRARLARRHHLAPGARSDDPVEIAGDLVGLHGTDPASVHLAALARLRAGSVGDVEKALYDDRALVRMLGMRRTMFVAPIDLAAVIQAAATRDVAEKMRRRYIDLLGRAGVAPDMAAWLREAEDAALAALAARGEATGAELSRDAPILRTSVLVAEGKAYEGRQNVTTWVLMLLSAEGRIVRCRPRGTWISSQYRWSALEDWLPGGFADWDTGEARVELVRRWLASFGPGTLTDLRWWTGWTAGETRKALARLDPVEVDLEGGGTGLVLPGDTEDPGPAEPWAALLPALDPTAMGWAERAWYLGSHQGALFDRSGNIGPTIWCDGRIVGGWGQRRDGSIAYRLLEEVGAERTALVAAEVERAAAWFGGVVTTPRFRTPLERELSA
ncbi:MAG TPA: winged helix DNA-binding domain-containing protein [Micromonosporaceae bacterium]|nr:winged helix DNA-binding domain-containing protein [Micromonosporaceae bacterium]